MTKTRIFVPQGPKALSPLEYLFSLTIGFWLSLAKNSIRFEWVLIVVLQADLIYYSIWFEHMLFSPDSICVIDSISWS